MLKLTKFYIALSTTLVLINSATASSLSESYKEETLSLLNFLHEAGIEKIACKNPTQECLFPAELIEKIKSNQINFEALDQLAKGSSATRKHAFYSPQKTTIYLNESLTHPQAIIGALGLHEVMGALGFPETEYSLSMKALVLKDLVKENSLDGFNKDTDYIIKLMESDASSRQKQTGVAQDNTILHLQGGDLVGGGGDPLALEQRALFLKYMLKATPHSRIKGQVWQAFKMSVPIEISENGSTITYVPSKVLANGWPEHIIVPRHLTTQPPQKDDLAPNAALEDIAHYFASVSGGLYFSYLIDTKSALFANERRQIFTYPLDESTLHPAYRHQYLREKWKNNCPHNNCKQILRR